jgi:exopolysaccharide biosynthesis polyprenyl glycosylphosphotransferase
MLRQQKLIRMQIHQLMDACLFAVAFWLSTELRANAHIIRWLNLQPAPPEEGFFWVFLFLIPAAPVILEWQGFYYRPQLCARSMYLMPLLRACLIAAGMLVASSFFFKLTFARWMVLWFPAIALVFVVFKEEVLRIVYRSQLGLAQAQRAFLLVGTPDETTRMREGIAWQREDDLKVVAELDLNQTPQERFVKMLHDESINGVVLSARHTHFDQVEEFVRACEIEGVEVWLMADFFKTQVSRPSFGDLQGRPMLVFRSAPEISWQALGKQFMDFFGSLFLLVTSSIVTIPVAILVKFTSPGPVFFKQQRAGLNGRPFTMYKFRTMVTNAEQLKQELAQLNEMSGPVFKLTNDPRITPIGRWLRKFSLDEFPQLINVLKGEMSLVGPRPLPVDEVARFDDLAHRRRLSVKPGLTCLWQVSGRNNVRDFRDWVRLDLQYIDHWSLWLDLRILIKTIPVVIMGRGAK